MAQQMFDTSDASSHHGTTPSVQRLLSTASVNLREEELVTREYARLKATNGQAEPLWVQECSALPAAQHFLRARTRQTLPSSLMAINTNTTTDKTTDADSDDPLVLEVQRRQSKAHQPCNANIIRSEL